MYLPRKTIAIVGPDGSGKSGFSELLAHTTGAEHVTIPGYYGYGSVKTKFIGSFLEDILSSIGHRFGSKKLVKASHKL
ncbi:MAG: hypothetical protein GOV01_01645, partial [Candidatus Altiarchaeota archaeon]|nr:hypothetical protein [Candidatus Altiarchaeota archaeon]